MIDFSHPNKLVQKSIMFNAKKHTCVQIEQKYTKMLPFTDNDVVGKNYKVTKDGKFAIMATICPDWRKK